MFWRCTCIFSLLLLILIHAGWAQSWEDLFIQASHDYDSNKYEQAIATLDAALEIAKVAYAANADDTTYGETIYLLGNSHRLAGNYTKAEALLKEYISTVDDNSEENHHNYVTALSDLMVLYYSVGQYQDAVDLCIQSLQAIKDVKGENDINYIKNLNNLAVIYSDLGYYNKAEALYKQVIPGYREHLGDTSALYALTLSNVSVLYLSLGRYEEAEKLLEKAAKIHLITEDEVHDQYAKILNNLAHANAELNHLDEAEAHQLKALEIYKKLYGEKHPNYMSFLNILTYIYLEKEEFQKAKETSEKAIGLIVENFGKHNKQYPYALANLARACAGIYDYEQAELFSMEAIDAFKAVYGEDHPDYTHLLIKFVPIYVRKQDYQNAELIYAQVYENNLKHIQNYFPALSEMEKEKYFTTMMANYYETFHSFILLRQAENPSVTAQQYNNQLAIKALLLNATQKVRQNIRNSGDENLLQQFEQWQASREKLAQYYQLTKEELLAQKVNLDSLEESANDLEKVLSAKSATFSQTFEQFTWQDVQNVLKEREAALEMIRFRKYSFGEKDFTDSIYYAALIITPDSEYPKLVMLEKGNIMENQLLKAYREDIQEGRRESNAYQYYWQPISEALEGVEKLYFSPDGVYHQINLATLYNESSDTYLLDELQVVNLTSTRDLLTRTPDSEVIARKEATLVGDPSFNISDENYLQQLAMDNISPTSSDEAPLRLERGYDLVPLPGTKQELEQVAQLLQNHQVETHLYLQEEALEEVIKQADMPGVLHIATHGFFEPDADPEKPYENPLLRSGLMLSGASRTLNDTSSFDPLVTGEPSEDGILTAYEATNLNLNHTELVVLSACETGLGDIRNGEGVYGLQRAFKIAGAEAILMSLWKVDDAATQALMTAFYEHWLDSKDKPEAFRLAQQHLRQQYPDPYYWGAFLLIGE